MLTRLLISLWQFRFSTLLLDYSFDLFIALPISISLEVYNRKLCNSIVCIFLIFHSIGIRTAKSLIFFTASALYVFSKPSKFFMVW